MDEDFVAFVAARQGALLRTAWLLTADEQQAQDLVQAALLRCWPRWHRVEPEGAEAYVRAVLVNVFRSWSRRRWRSEVPAGVLPEPPATDTWAGTDLTEVLRVALAGLPPRQRATLVLRFFHDLSEAQTAELLQCSAGTVKSQTSKALARLRADSRLAGLLTEVTS